MLKLGQQKGLSKQQKLAQLFDRAKQQRESPDDEPPPPKKPAPKKPAAPKPKAVSREEVFAEFEAMREAVGGDQLTPPTGARKSRRAAAG